MSAPLRALRGAPPAPTLLPPRAARVLQRKCACGGEAPAGGECAACRARREAALRRSATPGAPASAQTAPPIVHDVLDERGAPLDAGTRAAMESRFGHDFSGVRVHTGATAAASARAVGALAYTVGSHVAFDAGEYDPTRAAGRRLLAHELAHVVQQRGAAPSGPIAVAPAGGAHEDAASAASARMDAAPDAVPNPVSDAATVRAGPAAAAAVQRAPRAGTSTYDDRDVHLGPADPAAPGVASGFVRRRELNPQGDLIHKMDANVRFDPATCSVTVPVRVAYREPTAADFAQFASINPKRTAKPLPRGAGRAQFDRYLRETNARLNGWYSVQFGECKGAPCGGQTVPIEVEVVEQSANPDYTVAVLSAGHDGRSSVFQSQKSVVLAGPGGVVSDLTMAHEGSHMALGAGDEYLENELPHKEPSRVRDDFSLMNDQNAYDQWALLHERHFHFVATFLAAALQQAGTPCDVHLVETPRPTTTDFHVDTTLSGASLGGTGSFYWSASAGVGALSRSRNWRGFLDAHAAMIVGLDASDRSAFLLGARLGLERRFTPSSGGLTLSGYVGAGVGSFTFPDPKKDDSYGSITQRRGYGEAGGRLGYGVGASGGRIGTLFVEAAAGTTLDVSDPNHQHWFALGLGAAVEF